MEAGLPGRLRGRATFVVGKGGVGKTTLAGGLALALADGGERVHLLSTDPAHSLGDLFEQPLGSDPVPSDCGDRLVLEELNAAAVAADRLDALEPALREIMDRGTYLDEDDADSLLATTLPGLDEVGAVLRIAGLDAGRLIVDTAPTGHTLRFLRTPDVVRGWIGVFEAMAEKADAVASALVGRAVRLGAERELEALAGDLRSFEALVSGADFLVVTAAGEVVAAETARLVEALQARGLRIAGTVAVARGRPTADILLPARPGIHGCAALRSWWREVEDGPPSDTPVGMPGSGGDAPAAPGPMPLETEEPGDPPSGAPFPLPPAMDRGLLVFAGKGGVGKSTCAAAAAVRLAEGEPVVLLGSDPAGSLRDILGGTPVDRLEVAELDAEAELERWKARYRDAVDAMFEAVGLDASARLDRAVIASLWRLAPPGLDELMAVTRLAARASGPRLILDPAPTGHFLRLVAMPDLALDWIRRIMKILLKYGAPDALDGPANELLRFAKRFRTLRDRLADPARTAVIVVSLDEPLVRAESERLAGRLRALGIPVAGILVNRVRAPVQWPGGVVWRAPEVVEPRGVDRLSSFTRAWERVT